MIFTATCSLGMEECLAKELKSLNLQRVHAERAAVRFHSKSLADAYRACIQSRIASRILLRIHRFQGQESNDLYGGIQSINWSDHLPKNTAIWIDVVGTTKQLRHSQFTARLAKDAIVDQLREKGLSRPSVDRDHGLRIHIHIRNGVFTISLDLSGQSLHWRTPNRQSNAAPLKETLAAYLLHLAEWPKKGREGVALVDAMSGSGTLALEAASIALNIAPNLNRRAWGFHYWANHDETHFQEERQRARHNYKSTLPTRIIAADIDKNCIGYIKANAKSRLISGIEVKAANFLHQPPLMSETGIVVLNPPYGERLEDPEASYQMFSDIGDTLKQHYADWSAYILCPSKQHRHRIRLRHAERTEVFNGQLRCQWLCYQMYSGSR